MKEKDFRRQTGVKIETYEKMLEIVKEAHRAKKARGGRKNKITVEKMVLMTLEYLREYRTYFHIGKSYGVSESYAYKIIKWVEDVLIKDGSFALPGKKALLKNEIEQEVILIDATETPIERPKRGKSFTIQERKSDIR